MEKSPGRGVIFFYELLEFIMYPKEKPRSGSQIIFLAIKQFMEVKVKNSQDDVLRALSGASERVGVFLV